MRLKICQKLRISWEYAQPQVLSEVLYEDGWSIGDVIYYNKVLKEYKVSFGDGTDDFIPEDEIGGADVQVISTWLNNYLKYMSFH